MLTNETLEKRFSALNDVYFVSVLGDGYHYDLTVVSDLFIGKSKIARQRWVYAQINDLITTGELHAINMKTWSKEEWESKNG